MQNFVRLMKILTIGIYSLAVFYIFVVYFSSLDGIRDPSGADMVGRDFINFWSGGHAVIESNVDILYNRQGYRHYLIENFGGPINNYAFSYPPHSLLLFTPFGALPYVYGLALWTLGGVMLLYAACRYWFRGQYLPFWIVFGPASIIAILGGQTGIWLASLWLIALALTERRPIIAGILIGILTVKPQIGVLLALFLLCGGHWKVILSASLTSSVMIVMSVLLFGFEPWRAFIQDTLPFQSEVISESFGVFDYMVHTPFKWIINLNGNVFLAWSFQIFFMLFGVLGMIWASRKSVDKRFIICLLSVSTFLFSPYMVIYDMPVLTFSVCLYAQYFWEKHKAMTTSKGIVFTLAVALIVTPILGVFASAVDLPLSVVLMSLFIVVIIAEIQASTQRNLVSSYG